MTPKDARRLLDQIGVLRHPCDLDLLVFFARHPRALLSSESIAAHLGYPLKVIADSLDVLLGAGFLARRQTTSHAARLYVFEASTSRESDLGALVHLASTRDGRLVLRRAMKGRVSRNRASQAPRADAGGRPRRLRLAPEPGAGRKSGTDGR